MALFPGHLGGAVMTCEMGPGCWVCRMLEKIQVKLSEREGPKAPLVFRSIALQSRPITDADLAEAYYRLERLRRKNAKP